MAVMTAGQVAALAVDAGWKTQSDVETVVAIAYDESKFNTDAVGGPNSNGSKDYGLMQINSVHKPTSAEKHQPRANMLAARKVFAQQGFKAWSTYNHGLSDAAKKQGQIGYKKIKDDPAYAKKVVDQEKTPTVQDDIAQGDGLFGIPGAIKNATDAVGKTLFKIGINIGAGLLAIVLLVLGAVVLSRTSVAKVAATAAKVL